MENYPQKKIKLGICAMAKKIESTHMQNILKGIIKYNLIEIVIFTEDIIFNKEIENWPIVDALIIFFSYGFPYKKGQKYVHLRKPFLINDFDMQKVFWNRKEVLKILKEENILTPKNIIIDRGDIIDNDGEMNIKLNDSVEIEKMIQSEKNHQENLLLSNKNSESSSLISSEEEEEDEDKNIFENIKIEENNKNENNENLNEEGNENERKKNENNLNNSNNDSLLEFDDHIEYEGKKLFKPFVEKPFNGDDHFIYIYYPPNHGGGSVRLFRKTKDLCSYYFKDENNIRRDHSFIYEEFLQTDGFDIKVYTIGPEYAHAEARKSPSLDGKVQRSSEGKEIRYPINLTPEEKEYAKKIVERFKQNICGFDILRSNGKSYVCDVNGWSFVKGNKKYYDDCASLLNDIILKKLDYNLFLKKKNLVKNVPIMYKRFKLPEVKQEELLSVVSIFRHADRSPKQKMKFVVEDKDILSLFDKFKKREEDNNDDDENKKKKKKKKNKEIKEIKEIKLKSPKELTYVLDLVRSILKSNNINEKNLNDDNNSFFLKLFQIRLILEKNPHFDGMTRKIQLKPLETELIEDPKSKKSKLKVKKALMILKWGGNITHSGIDQARVLGKTFRVEMYPSTDGSGLLRLHSTYRHDLKCYSSDEGRCLMTAASFLQGFLQLDAPIIPIISSMVRKNDDTANLLDVSSEKINVEKTVIKQEISECLNFNDDMSKKFETIFKREDIYYNFDEQDNSFNDDKKDFENGKDNNNNNCKNNSNNNNNNDNNDNNNINEEDNCLNIRKSKSNISNDSNNIDSNNLDPYPVYNLMKKIGNPYQRMKIILDLINKLLEHIKSFLGEDELKMELDTFYIKLTASIKKPPPSNKNLPKINVSKDSTSENTNETQSQIKEKENKKKEEKEKNKTKSPNKKTSNRVKFASVGSIIYDSPKRIKTVNTMNNLTVGEELSLIPTESIKRTPHDCEDEKIILMYKRYLKLREDFFNGKKNIFDVTKIPDIYDNIKYDIIHNRELLNDDAFELYDEIVKFSNFILPFEYGISIKEKMNIGIKIIRPLLTKIYKDIMWWNYSNSYSQLKNGNQIIESEKGYSGLNESMLDASEIKSTWRHVKTRFYFTCSSHMYSLLNLLIYGYNSFLLGNNNKVLKELRNIFDLDYCSHITFRLFENLNLDVNNPKRFRLELIMSPGSSKDPRKADNDHFINVSPWIILNNHLTLSEIKEYFSKFTEDVI